MEQLLDLGASIDGVLRRGSAEFGTTAGMGNISLATLGPRQDNAAMIRLLISRGANPTLSAANGLTPFASMCALGHVPDMSTLLEIAPQVLLSRNRQFGMREGSTRASPAKGRAPVAIEYTRERGRHDDGLPARVALGGVEYLGDRDVLTLLLDHGCAPTIRPHADQMALVAAPRSAPCAGLVARPTRSSSTSPSAACSTAARGCAPGQPRRGGAAAATGAEVASTQSLLRMTPLHCAAIGGHGEMCAALLHAGAPTSLRDRTGRTPAAWAKRRGNAEIVRLLAAAAAGMELSIAPSSAGSSSLSSTYPAGVVVEVR